MKVDEATQTKWNRVAQNSPIRRHPAEISEKQIILLDGIRYSADMAGIALDRLWSKLCAIDQMFIADGEVTAEEIADAALDAWSIVDAAHRFSDLVCALPGLPNASWKKMLKTRLHDACNLRNSWQHIGSHVDQLVADRGQAWGALAWMQHIKDKPTGKWFLAVAGSDFKGSSWTAGGPAKAVARVGTRRIRLLHDHKTLYLSRVVRDIFEALKELEKVLQAGDLKLVGDRVNQPRANDTVMFMALEVLVGI